MQNFLYFDSEYYVAKKLKYAWTKLKYLNITSDDLVYSSFLVTYAKRAVRFGRARLHLRIVFSKMRYNVQLVVDGLVLTIGANCIIEGRERVCNHGLLSSTNFHHIFLSGGTPYYNLQYHRGN